METLEKENIVNIRLSNITKAFGSVVANNNISFDIYDGEIISLLGENGSGKTTLMNMLSGIYYPDAGEIYIKGNKVSIKSPKDAFGLGIGMIHQHFKLVDNYTAADNIAVFRQQSQKRVSRGTFAAAAFPDYSQNFTFFQLKRNTVYGVYLFLSNRKLGLQVINF